MVDNSATIPYNKTIVNQIGKQMKLLDKFLGNPLLYILIGAVIGGGMVIGGLVADVAILTTLGGLVLGLTVGGVVIVYIALVLCLGLMR